MILNPKQLGISNAEAITVKMYKVCFSRSQLVLRIQTLAVASFLFFVSDLANAATWYVDNTAIGANNGTSWNNAWTSLGSASGSSVAPGDTVFISGGPSGLSQTYSIGSGWTPKSGTLAGGRITYQIGQDLLHNGTAIFNTSTFFLANSSPVPSYINIIGSDGDGAEHFVVNNCAAILYQGLNFTDLRIGYVNFGNVSGNADCINIGNAQNFEFDHNYCYDNYNDADAFMNANFSGTTYDGNLIHDNTVFVPSAGSRGGGYGADCLQISGTGFSIYNNVLIAYDSSTWLLSEGQHQDGWQTAGGSYIKIYNNYIFGFSDIGIYGGCWGDAVSGGSHTFTNVRIYNNIIDSDQWQAVGSIEIEADNQAGSTFSNIVVANNLCRVNPGAQGWCFFFGSSATTGGTWVDDWCTNNICIAPSGNYLVSVNCTFGFGNNPEYTDAQASNLFLSFTAGSTNNNYNLVSTATNLIGKGINFSSYFTTDKNGNPRPASGAWDIGPYEYGSSSGLPAPLAPTIIYVP